MKQYIIDQLIFLILGIWMMSILPWMCGYIIIFTIISELIAILSLSYLCRRILVLPLDLILKKRREEVFFSKVSSINDYEFFKGKYCCEWKFYSSKGTMEVLVPVALTEEEIHNMEKPLVDQKVRICFYRFSKILYSWEIL